ncbi:HtrA protease/chaperone protein [Dissulfuribacter thermophilus]|uniref:Probable periplasmic serine endoprotease DegP-like n=1 Tax=Dissulfuribacter thermophilus TaxID=1156395 RepID=A0A1B9F7Z4_9BACT|nr:DegQ family serine endoprotease [Dissulfuribacter thermophilus]OCC15891.1 HtrA protease/chaperone protein [Dissulfuribacter thermophilus]
MAYRDTHKGLALLYCLLSIFILSAFYSPVSAKTLDPDIILLDRTAKAFAKVVQKARPAVVFIKVEKTIESRGTQGPFNFMEPFDFFNDPFFERFFGPRYHRPQPKRKFKQRGQGSGFIVDKRGYILTNNHVVGDADLIEVKLFDGREFKAKVVGTDPQSDVAVIKIDADDDLPVLPLGDSDKVKVGEWVIAVGNPFGLSETVTVGVVSAKGRNRIGINDYEDFIQTDAAINPGNSGGPLINIRGEAIGMNTAIFSRSGGYMGIGFAIPINMAKAVMKQLIEKGKVVRGWLGVVIQEVDEDLAKSFGLEKPEGVLVAEVSEDSPAKRGGLKQGDIILQLNGQKVKDAGELRNKIALTPPGTRVRLLVLRDGEKKLLVVKIGEKPGETTVAGVRKGILKKLGLSLQDLTPELAEQFGYKEGQGVLVSEVEPGSPAESAGIRAGYLIEEVNRIRVKTVAQCMNALRKSKHRVLLRLTDGQFTRYVVIRLE